MRRIGPLAARRQGGNEGRHRHQRREGARSKCKGHTSSVVTRSDARMKRSKAGSSPDVLCITVGSWRAWGLDTYNLEEEL